MDNVVGMRFIDTHCHFDFPPFIDNASQSLQQAEKWGVKAIIIPAISAQRFVVIHQLVQQYLPLYAAYGLHPLYISGHDEAALAALEVQLSSACTKTVAIGEIGLDAYQDKQSLSKQQWLLRKQLDLAKQYDLPVILHSRKTHDLLAQELKRVDLPRTGVIHGFSGSLVQAQHFIRLGYFIGVGGVISYPRAQKTRKTMAALPLESLLLETDAPDMPLMGYQGQPNRPERLKQIVEILYEIRAEKSLKRMAETLFQTSRNLFGL